MILNRIQSLRPIYARRNFLFDRDKHDSVLAGSTNTGKSENGTGNIRQGPGWTASDHCVPDMSRISRLYNTVKAGREAQL